jgi:uncharacterized YkwD family protein
MRTQKKALLIGLLALSTLLIPLADNSIALASEPVTSPICVSINEDASEIREGLALDSDTLIQAKEGQIFEVVVRYKQTLGLQLDNDKIGYLTLSEANPFVPIITLEPDWIPNPSYTTVQLPKPVLTVHNIFNLSAPITSVASFQPTEEKVLEPEPAVVEKAPAKPEPKPVVTVPKEAPPQVVIVKPEPEPVQIPSTYLSSTESKMLQLVNQVRESKGISALKLDTQLTDIARLKSQDIIDQEYFAHISPTYGSPIDMLKYFGVDYRGMGENLAGDQSVEKAHAALVKSPGHLANILNPDFTHVGIGIRIGGKYENVYTQLFIGKL